MYTNEVHRFFLTTSNFFAEFLDMFHLTRHSWGDLHELIV